MADDDRSDPGGTDTGPVATVIQLDRPTEPAPEEHGEGSQVPPSGPGSGETATVLVDQRMRRRRITVQREAGQRRLWRLVWVLAPLALLVDGAALAHLPLFDVDRISVEGAVLTPPGTVTWASRIDRGDTLATLDEHGAERRIERLPWVADADVIRQWPSTVRIVVVERQPAAVIYGDVDSAGAVVDRDARVLDIGGMVPFGLMTVDGVEGELSEGRVLPAAAVPALDLAVELNERLPGVVMAVNVDLDATLTSGGIVRFGSVEGLEDKLVALDALVSDVDLSDLVLLDLRVPSSPALRRNG
jgi:cell division protein FtsQ